MNDDELKNLFNKTFAEEHIPFDPGAWPEMEKMLSHKKRRRAFWMWFSGTGTLLVFLAVYSLMSATSQAVYEPRHERFEAQNLFNQAASQEPIALVEQSQTTEKLQSSETVNHSQRSNSSSSKDKTVSNNISSGNALKTDVKSTVQTEENALDDRKLSNVQTGSNTQADLVNIDGETQLLDQSMVQKMPMLTLEVTETNTIVPSNEDVAHINEPKRPIPYVRFGVSRVFDPGLLSSSAQNFGQIAGIGFDYQLAHHLLISAELNASHDAVNYSYTNQSVYFGYDATQLDLTVNVHKMVYAEIPLLLRYRSNKFTIGGGLNTGLLTALNVVEGSRQSGAQLEAKEIEKKQGYVRWDAMPPLLFSLAADAQYQLSERMFIGTRFTFGLNDVWLKTPEIDRKNRLELYLKVPIK
ncbi:MAG: outer membrane beta-barrel protein [Salibacteraceae bacterium]